MEIEAIRAMGPEAYDRFSDRELIQLYRSGNNIAFEKLVHRQKDRIFTTIIYRVKDGDLAEDVFQEVFIKIINAIHTKRYLDNGLSLTWASRIAHNENVSYFRKYKTRQEIMNVRGLSSFVEGRDDLSREANKLDLMMRKELYEEVESLLDRLPQPQREELILRYYADLSFREMATITDASINTALGRVRYALLNIRKIWGNENLIKPAI
ncbi:RNA polymerase sigma factor [Chitinophaga sp. 22536]|uniref:RNA polymerase sigma factor n=1 Tax=unclassified Chitinophaga TaxID=2619133 RepID=UPI003F879791